MLLKKTVSQQKRFTLFEAKRSKVDIAVPSARRSLTGFTLVELLVVIAIISVLATLLLLQLGIARAKARDAKRIADVNQVRSAMELYFDDYGSYPGTTAPSTAPDMSFLVTLRYLINIPRDPLVTGCTDIYDGADAGGFNCYGYAWDPAANPQRLQVWSELETRSTALDYDTDINSTGWSGAEVRGDEDTDCTNDTPADCIYDVGQM